MVLTFLVGFGAVFGGSEGLRSAQAKGRREEHRSRKNNLTIHVPKSSRFSASLEGRSVVLSGDRCFIDTGVAHDEPFGHPFEGYFLPYPESRFAGLVSSITPHAPIMNWIFVDRDTYQVRFGNRAASEGHMCGPWDCTRQDHRLTFGGWEGFCAVYEGGIWGLYFDRDGDMLRGKLGTDRVVLDVDIIRRELRMKKPMTAEEIEAQNAAQEAAAIHAEKAAAAQRAAQEAAYREALAMQRAEEQEAAQGNRDESSQPQPQPQPYEESGSQANPGHEETEMFQQHQDTQATETGQSTEQAAHNSQQAHREITSETAVTYLEKTTAELAITQKQEGKDGPASSRDSQGAYRAPTVENSSEDGA